jgi:hypothetical protein
VTNADRLHKYARRLADHLLVASQDEREELFDRIRQGLRLRARPFPWFRPGWHGTVIRMMRRNA